MDMRVVRRVDFGIFQSILRHQWCFYYSKLALLSFCNFLKRSEASRTVKINQVVIAGLNARCRLATERVHDMGS